MVSEPSGSSGGDPSGGLGDGSCSDHGCRPQGPVIARSALVALAFDAVDDDAMEDTMRHRACGDHVAAMETVISAFDTKMRHTGASTIVSRRATA